MREDYPELSLLRLCGLFGISRQAYYQHKHRQARRELEAGLVLWWVRQIREFQPRIGMGKLYVMLRERMAAHQIKLGRDRFFDLLTAHKLQIRRRRRKIRTTYSNHVYYKYPNLITGLEVSGPHQLWVSDLTYLKTGMGTLYLSLVTDAYSRKIVGFALGPSLEAIYCLEALHMAIAQLPPGTCGVIHHSDRGIQYCSIEYIETLLETKIQISMTQSGDPLENAIAERVNGILKDELIDLSKISELQQGKKQVHEAIEIYNTLRLHQSIDYLTPEMAHQLSGPIKRRWKNYRAIKYRSEDVNDNQS